jgi:hypothetical protein
VQTTFRSHAGHRSRHLAKSRDGDEMAAVRRAIAKDVGRVIDPQAISAQTSPADGMPLVWSHEDVAVGRDLLFAPP